MLPECYPTATIKNNNNGHGRQRVTQGMGSGLDGDGAFKVYTYSTIVK